MLPPAKPQCASWDESTGEENEARGEEKHKGTEQNMKETSIHEKLNGWKSRSEKRKTPNNELCEGQWHNTFTVIHSGSVVPSLALLVARV